MPHFSILHTSDMHGRLNEECCQKLIELKAQEPETLLLDSGDAIHSGNITFNPFGEHILSLMNAAGYDAMSIGNREYHFLGVPMCAKTFKAEFPLLSANLITTKKIPNVAPYADFELSGLRIRIMGLSVPCVTKSMFIHKLSSQYFDDPVKYGTKIAESYRRECDVLIALTHIGIRKDTELAQNTSAIDLILGGHTHTLTEEPVKVGHTIIIHHGYHAKSVGKTNIKVENGSVFITNEILPLKV